MFVVHFFMISKAYLFPMLRLTKIICLMLCLIIGFFSSFLLENFLIFELPSMEERVRSNYRELTKDILSV